MFNNHGSELASSSKPCRPDPEDQLKDIRKRREAVQKAQSLLTHLVDLPIRFNNHTTEQEAEQVINAMLGELYLRIIQLEKEEAYILVEIDNPTR